MSDQNTVEIATQSKPENTPQAFHTICPILVGVGGGSASGKTTLCNKIISNIGLSNCTVISLDSFYKGVDMNKAKDYNFDHPDALDFDVCYEVIKQLLTRQKAYVPIYNFKTHQREEEKIEVMPGDMILFEGILALHDPRIVALMNLKIFVDCDDDIRLYRRLLRDVKERARDVSSVLYQYNRFVKPAFDGFIKPSVKYANIIVPGNNDNTVAINFIVQNLKSQLTRLEDMKKNMNSNFFHIDILDSCWLNVQDGQHRDSNELALYHSNKIIFLRDPNSKSECISVFDLFSSQFSKTLYKLSMVRFITYAIKMMKRYNARRESKRFELIHYLQDPNENLEKILTSDNIGIIVPFLYNETVVEIQKKVDLLLEKKPELQIFVLSIFASMDVMTSLTRGKENIYVVNILCIVDMKNLLDLLQQNCKFKFFDFVGNEDFIKLLVESGQKELSRKTGISNKNAPQADSLAV